MTKNNLIKLLVGKKYIFLGERNFWAIFWSFWGQNTKTFKHGGFIYQNEALEPKISKTVFSWSLEVTLSKNGVIRGHFGSKSVDFQTYGFYISKWSSWATDCEKVLPKVIRGHTNLKSGSFAVIWGQTGEFSNMGFIYQNEALEPVISKNLISRSPEVTSTRI